METLSAMLARVGELLAEIRLLGGEGLSLLQRDVAVVVAAGLAVVTLGMLLWRHARPRKPGDWLGRWCSRAGAAGSSTNRT